MNNELTIDEVVAKHEAKYPNIVELFLWSQNYEYPSPMSYFLDLIGYSSEELGDTLGDWAKVQEKISLLELAYIADALQEYVNDAERAYEVIQELVNTEGQ
jgi:hypothetical protein